MEAVDGKVFGTLAILGFLGLMFRFYRALVLKPRKLRELLQKQGISGPLQSVFLGNIKEIRKATSTTTTVSKAAPGEVPVHHDCGTLFPFIQKWRKQFGEIFTFGLGNIQIVYVTNSTIVKDITTCTSLDLGKPSYQAKDLGPLLGQGIITSNGPIWAHQRKVIAPELYMAKAKGMVNLVNDSTLTLVNSWNNLIEAAGDVAEINVNEHLTSFSDDIMSRVCFGSNYEIGKEIFHKLSDLAGAMSKKVLSSGIPGMRYLPTKYNRYVWGLEKEVRSLILNIVHGQDSSETNLLQMILEGMNKSNLSKEVTDRFIVDNCKNIYFAGLETVAISTSWSLMLLAANPEWQDRVRSEVVEVCGGRVLNWDMLQKLKLTTMVIYESLRLYTPASTISREALKDMKFGDFQLPKGVNVWMFIPTLHTDPENWGPDSYNFNPNRFANGIKGACKQPHLYMPFGVGPRICLGQNLAMIELKIILASIVCNFSFKLSPKYVHSPTLRIVIQPEFGVKLLVEKL